MISMKKTNESRVANNNLFTETISCSGATSPTVRRKVWAILQTRKTTRLMLGTVYTVDSKNSIYRYMYLIYPSIFVNHSQSLQSCIALVIQILPLHSNLEIISGVEIRCLYWFTPCQVEIENLQASAQTQLYLRFSAKYINLHSLQ